MRNSREICRQKWLLGRAHRAIAESVGVSLGVVSKTLQRASAAGLTWEAVEGIEDQELERRLYPHAPAESERPEPDCVWVHRERHRPGVTLELLHHEYLERHPNGLRYTAFCDRYREWMGRRGLVMRQVHAAGDKVFIDYSGKRPRIVDAATGEVIDVELFVAVLGASNLTYAEASYTQRGPDWIASHVRALEYFGGVPAALVPDQLKSGVTRSCLYEPGVQRTYEELAEHYGTTVMPARPSHPRDKAKVEVAVQIAQRWLLARNRRFASAPRSRHDAHRALQPTDDLKQVLQWKEQRLLTQNLTVHYKRSLYLVEDTPQAQALRGKTVDVYETEDGVVRIRFDQTELPATTFAKDGGVRQQDIDDNKYLATILRGVQKAQLERDENRLPSLTLRRQRALKTSIAQRRAAT